MRSAPVLRPEELKAVKYAALLFLLLVSTSTRAQNVSREARTPCAPGSLNEEPPETAKLLSTFLETIKTALSSNDKQKVADMSAYPLRVATDTGKFKIRSREEFMQKYEQIFPKSLVDFLEAQQPQCISRVGARGFTVGLGEFWFDQYPDGTVKFFAINPVALDSTPPQDQCKVDRQLKVIKSVDGVYSEEANKNSVEGKVVMCVTVNAEGKVTEARGLSGPADLMPSSIDALKQWQFERPTNAPTTTMVEMSYSVTKACPGGGKGQDVGTVNVTIEPGHTAEGQTGDPLKLVGNAPRTQPPYPEKARAQRRRGQLYLSISVNGNGDVVDAKIVKGLDELLDEPALETARTWKFEVTPHGGNTTVLRVIMSFQIPCLDDPANK